MEKGTRGICRHCEGSLIWWKPTEQIDRGGLMVPRSDRPRWWHMRPDLEALNRERNVFEDDTHGYLGAGCPTKEGTLPGHVGEPREYCCELKGEYPKVVCNKPVVDPELMMCGVHIKKHREHEEWEERHNANTQEQQAARAGIQEICARLLDNFNLKTEPASPSWGHVQMKVTVDPFDLEELLLGFAKTEDLSDDDED